jgi:Na+/H+ antiporter NhaD/arsenite permease-like protein
MDVVKNTGVIMFIVTISSSLYLYLVFRKDFKINPDLEYLKSVNPSEYLKDKKELIVSLSILFIVILVVI